MFCKKCVLKNFAKFTGKDLCQRLFFNKVANIRPAILLRKSLWHRYFRVNFAEFVRAPFLTEHLRWLLLTLARYSVRKSVVESGTFVVLYIPGQSLSFHEGLCR